MSTFTIAPTVVIQLPLSRQAFGFPRAGDRGNVVLLDVCDCDKPEMIAAYRQAGFVHEGVRLASCDKRIDPVLEQMHLPWCPWPGEGFTLVVLEYSHMGLLADQLVVQQYRRVDGC